MQHHEPECYAKRFVGHFKVKVTARAHMIKIWQFRLYLLNCWSFCNQTGFDNTFSKARVSYEEIGLLCSRSLSQQNFRMSVNVQIKPSELLNLLPRNLVWWRIIVSQIVYQKDLFAVFKVKVTVKDHIIKYDSLSCPLNCWSVCNWTWFYGASS